MDSGQDSTETLAVSVNSFSYRGNKVTRQICVLIYAKVIQQNNIWVFAVGVNVVVITLASSG